MRVAVFLNVGAGSANLVSPEFLRELFLEAGVAAEVHSARQRDLEPTLSNMLRLRPDAVVAAGGDGTLSTIAARLAGTGIPMGVLPLGTRNHFAKDLAIPLDLREAVHCISQRQAHAIDVGEVNGRLFINNSSIGAYPQIVVERETRRARMGIPKWLGNVIGLVKVLRHWPMLYARLELDGRSFTRITPFVFVGNNEYTFNPRNERHRERLHAGELCVFMIHARNLWDLLRLFWLSLRNRLNEARDFESHFGRELTVYPHRRHVRVSIDGEVCRVETPLRYRLRPGALLVFSPGGREVRAAEPGDEGDRAHFRPALRN